MRLNPPNKDPTIWEGLPHEVSTFGHNISLEISKFQEVPLEQLEAHISKNGTDLEYEVPLTEMDFSAHVSILLPHVTIPYHAHMIVFPFHMLV